MALDETPPVILQEIIKHLDGKDMVNLVLAFPSLGEKPPQEDVSETILDADYVDNMDVTLTRTEEDMQMREIDEDTNVHLNMPIPAAANLFRLSDYSTTVGGDIEVELDAPCINMYRKKEECGWRLDMVTLKASPKSSKTRMQSEIRCDLSDWDVSENSKGDMIHRFWSHDKSGTKRQWRFDFKSSDYCDYKLTDDNDSYMYAVVQDSEGQTWAVRQMYDKAAPETSLCEPETAVLISVDPSSKAIVKLVGDKTLVIVGGDDNECNSLAYVDWVNKKTQHITYLSVEFFASDDWLLNIPCASSGSDIFLSLDGSILRLRVDDNETIAVCKYDCAQFNQGELALDVTERFLFSWTPERQAILDLSTGRLILTLPAHRYESRFVGILDGEVHVWRFHWSYIKEVFDNCKDNTEFDFSQIPQNN